MENIDTGPLRPRAFDTHKLEAESRSPWDARVMMQNLDLQFRLWRNRTWILIWRAMATVTSFYLFTQERRNYSAIMATSKSATAIMC